MSTNAVTFTAQFEDATTKNFTLPEIQANTDRTDHEAIIIAINDGSAFESGGALDGVITLADFKNTFVSNTGSPFSRFTAAGVTNVERQFLY